MAIKNIDGPEVVEIDAKCLGESPSGLAVFFHDGDKKFSIPISVMEDWPDEGETGTVIIHRWFAEQNNFI